MEKTIELRNIKEAQALFGLADENLKAIENEFGVSVFSRGSQIKLKGSTDNIRKAEQLIHYILDAIRGGQDEIDGGPHYCDCSGCTHGRLWQ